MSSGVCGCISKQNLLYQDHRKDRKDTLQARFRAELLTAFKEGRGVSDFVMVDLSTLQDEEEMEELPMRMI